VEIDDFYAELLREFPGAGMYELQRFRTHFKTLEKTKAGYRNHLEWRRDYLDHIWTMPRAKQDVFRFLGRAYDGSVILHVAGSLYDPAEDVQTYRAYMHRMLERIFPDRNSLLQAIWIIDGRKNPGHPNALFTRIFPFFRVIAQDLKAHYPQRCCKVILFPLTKLQWFVLDAFLKVVADPATYKKVLSGGELEVGEEYPSALAEFADLSTLAPKVLSNQEQFELPPPMRKSPKVTTKKGPPARLAKKVEEGLGTATAAVAGVVATGVVGAPEMIEEAGRGLKKAGQDIDATFQKVGQKLRFAPHRNGSKEVLDTPDERDECVPAGGD
jgi:hypothetical protein